MSDNQQNNPVPRIEFEVTMCLDLDEKYNFSELDSFIEKMRKLYEDKCDLRIKVTGISF